MAINASTSRKLPLARTVDWWKVSAFPETVTFPTPALATSGVTVLFLTAIERMVLRFANAVFPVQPATAAPTVQIQNLTQTLNLTTALSIPTTYTVNTTLNFVVNSTQNGGADSNLLVKPGDVLALVYVVNGASAGPGAGAFTLEFALSGRYK